MLNTAGRTRSTLEYELAEAAASPLFTSFSSCHINEIRAAGKKCDWKTPDFQFIRRTRESNTHKLKLPNYGMTSECISTSSAALDLKSSVIKQVELYVKGISGALDIKVSPDLSSELDANIDLTTIPTYVEKMLDITEISVSQPSCNLAASSKKQRIARKGVINALRDQLVKCPAIKSFIKEYATTADQTSFLLGGMAGTCGCSSWMLCCVLTVVAVYLVFNNRFDYFSI